MKTKKKKSKIGLYVTIPVKQIHVLFDLEI